MPIHVVRREMVVTEVRCVFGVMDLLIATAQTIGDPRAEPSELVITQLPETSEFGEAIHTGEQPAGLSPIVRFAFTDTPALDLVIQALLVIRTGLVNQRPLPVQSREWQG